MIGDVLALAGVLVNLLVAAHVLVVVQVLVLEVVKQRAQMDVTQIQEDGIN